ncbi:MAG: NAD(P)H-dependent oxidoreductase [Dysgonomonas sp.]
MENTRRKVVILLAHPNLQESDANKTLIEAVKDPVTVAVYDLYEEKEISTDEWMMIMTHASALVFQFPFHWLSAPSLLKKWLDEVFIDLSQTPSIAGKPLMIATTTGSSFESYRSGGKNGYTVDELLRPYQVAATQAGMVWKTPLVIYGMQTQEAAKNISLGTDAYKNRINLLKDKEEEQW